MSSTSAFDKAPKKRRKRLNGRKRKKLKRRAEVVCNLHGKPEAFRQVFRAMKKGGNWEKFLD